MAEPWQEDVRKKKGRQAGHHQFLSVLKLVTDCWFFKDETKNYVLIIIETDGDSSQAGSA